jgi:hypothetical protein
MSYRLKTLSLQRAYFKEGYNNTLEALLTSVGQKLPKIGDRIAEVDLITRHLIASISPVTSGQFGGVMVRILEFEKGAIGVINLDTTDDDAVVEEFSHPSNRDFLKDEIVIYVVRNHIVACNIKNKSGTLTNDILTLAGKVELLPPDAGLRIADVPDSVTMTKLKDVGVKKIEFSVRSYIENMNLNTRNHGVMGAIKMIFASPPNRQKASARANTVARMTLARGRFMKEEERKDEWLTGVGVAIMEEQSDDFKIVLEDGTEISNSKLKKTKRVKLKRHANSFWIDSARMALIEYYKDLLNDGSLKA